jgi:hypothetical protein
MRPNTSIVTTAFADVPAKARVAAYDWQALAQDLDGFGCAVLPKLLSPVECRAISSLYSEEEHFRSHVHMARHGFGKGGYRYFKYPLPDIVRPSFRARGASAWCRHSASSLQNPSRPE